MEAIVVDETKEHESYCGQGRRFSDFYSIMSEGNATDFDADNESQDGADIETDKDDGIFFDTNDFLSSKALRITSYWCRKSGNGCIYDKDALFSDCLCGPEKKIRIDQYPYVKRRDNLPEPKDKREASWLVIYHQG